MIRRMTPPSFAALRGLVVRALSSGAARRVLERGVPRLDRAVYRMTGGRASLSSLLSGLPVVLLTTTGARTGRRRQVLLLSLVDGDRVVVTAANWGGARNPGWYHNLRARPEATISVRGVERAVVAHEAEGAERERLWRLGLARVPARLGEGWTDNPHRRIPVLVLTPSAPGDRRAADDQPTR
jgi:deazaflavin-dependent oxidoreductase (nitroreductase family)